MVQPEINYLAVLVVAVIYYLFGGLWYSPVLFGKVWLRLGGCSEENLKKSAAGGYIGSFIASLVMAYVMAMVIGWTGSDTYGMGLWAGFYCWAGFVATTHTANALFTHKPTGLNLIDIGYPLVGLLVMGAILAIW
jgi:hypothetical protein